MYKKIKSAKQFITTATATDKIKPLPVSSVKNILLQPLSITIIIVKLQ